MISLLEKRPVGFERKTRPRMRWDEKSLEEWTEDLLEGCPNVRGTLIMTEVQEKDDFMLWAQIGRKEYARVVRARLRRLKHKGDLPPEAGSRLERVWRKHVERCRKLFRDAAPGRAERRARFYDPI